MSTFPGIQNSIYITPTQIRRIIGTLAQSTNDDDILMRFAEEVSRRIDRYTNRYFYPLKKTILVDWPGTSFDLKFPQDLISLTTLTNGNGQVIPTTDVTTGNPNYFLYEQDLFPKWKMQLSIISGIVFLFVGTPQQAISIEGLWGYPAYEQDGTWKEDSGATVQEAVSQNATQTTLVVETGTVQAGQTLYIDDEFEIVQSVSVMTPASGLDTLTVSRGKSGSTAAIHLRGVKIYTVLVQYDIARAAERMIGWAFRQKDAQIFSDIGVVGLGQISLPLNLPQDVTGILRDYVRGHRR